MELSQESIHDVIHPTAAYKETIRALPNNVQYQSQMLWEQSSLNPKNRIDSLEPVRNPSWRIDGCTAFGTQYYAVPTFMDLFSPVRMDVFVPELTTLPCGIRDVLDVDVVFHTRDAGRISRLGITRHILRILEHWTSTMPEPRAIFDNVPFGSRIVLENMPVDVSAAKVIVAPAYYVERHLLPLSSLQAYWGTGLDYPPTVDIANIVFVSQLHDSVCLVRFAGKLWILKALASYTKYLYHELRSLLQIPPHPNIVARPCHLVTKACSFGSKIAVVGFTLEYHEHGSLRDLVPFLRLHREITVSTAVDWSVQLASALLHLRETTGTFYSDLRLDNIVLSGDGRVVLIDFEQRGVWCSFGAPEVNAFDYVRLLAVDGDIPAPVQRKYAELLTKHLPGWSELGDGEEYLWPSTGYNIAWGCLTPIEQEACEVYMLGRVLWCIFEAHSAPQRSDVWLSYRWEPIVEFPDYVHTPQPMQDLIDRCTRGRSPGLNRTITREGNLLVLRELEGTGRSTAEQVQNTAQKWWAEEIEAAEKWIEQRAVGLESGDWKENYYDRPTLREVYTSLSEYQRSGGPDAELDLAGTLRRILG